MKRVLLLLCKGVEVYEAAAFYDVLGWAREYGTEAVEVVTVGLQKEVRGTFGIKVIRVNESETLVRQPFDSAFSHFCVSYLLEVIARLTIAGRRWLVLYAVMQVGWRC
jgi:hypothetical protein